MQRALLGNARPLDPAIRATAEAGLGLGLADVKVHRGGAADGAASGLNARAFTSGDHIVLGSGASRETLAHELVHVAQARRFGDAVGSAASGRSDPSEREARRLAPRLLAGESALDVRERPSAGLQRDEPAYVIVPVAGTAEPLAAYPRLRERLTPADWNALNAAARRRADKILSGAESRETGERVATEVTVPLDTLFDPAVTESRRAGGDEWMSDVFAWGMAGGAAATAQMGARIQEEILHRWLNHNLGLLTEDVTVALVDPEGQGGGAGALLSFSLRGSPVAAGAGLLSMRAVDDSIDGGGAAMIVEISGKLGALATAVEKTGKAQAMLKAARDVGSKGHDEIAAEALRQIDAAMRGGLAGLDSVKESPLADLVAPTAGELRSYLDGDFAALIAAHDKWRADNPRSVSGYEMGMESLGKTIDTQREMMKGDIWDRMLSGYVGMSAYHQAQAVGTQNIFLGGAPEQARQLGLAYDKGLISFDSWSKGVDAAETRGWIFGGINVALMVATAGLGYAVGGSLSFGGSVAFAAGTGFVTAAVPMISSNIYTSYTDFSDPALQQWWKGGMYSTGDILLGGLLGAGIGAAFPIAGRLLGGLRGQGAMALAALEAGGPLPEGVVARTVQKGVVELTIASEGVTIRLTSKGYQVVGRAGTNAKAVIEEGVWPAELAGEHGLGPGTRFDIPHPRFPTSVGFGERGWGMVSPQSSSPLQFGLWPDFALPAGAGVQPAATVSPLLLEAAAGRVVVPTAAGDGMMLLSGMNIPHGLPTAASWPQASPFLQSGAPFMPGAINGFGTTAARTPLMLGPGSPQASMLPPFMSQLPAPFLAGLGQLPAGGVTAPAPTLPPFQSFRQSGIPSSLIGPHVPESFQGAMSPEWAQMSQSRVSGSLPALGPFGEWQLTPRGWTPVYHIFPPGGVPALSLTTYGTGGASDFLVDLPGQVKVAITSPRPGGNYHGPRNHPMTAAEMVDPVSALVYGQGHVIPQHLTKNAGPGQVVSSEDPRNFVAQFRKYNEWIRNQMEQKLKREGTPYTVFVVIGPQQRLTNGGYIIPDAEIFTQYGADGSAIKAWRFPLTDPNFYDNLKSTGSFQDVLPQFEIDIGAVPRSSR